MATAITKESQYVLKPEAVRAKRYQRVIPSLGNNPNNGYQFGDTVLFYLPGGLRNQVMDGQTAYLRFNLRFTVAAAGGNIAANAQDVTFDHTASSIIRRLDIYGSGGALIESIDNYNALANVLYDVSHTQSELRGLSTLIGSSDGTTAADNRLGLLMSNRAQILNGNTETVDYLFSIPILSSIFQLSEKYFPIYALGDDIRVEVILDTQVRSLVYTPVANATVTITGIFNPEIIVDYLEMQESARIQMESLYQPGGLMLHSTSYHNYQTSITVNTTNNFNTILPAKVKSAKNALIIFRELGATAVQDAYTQSVRSNPFTGALSQFNLQVGGMRVPQRPITANRANDVSEFFAELQKAFHALGDVRFSGCLDYTCYLSRDNVTNATSPAAAGFVVGINLDTLVRQTDAIMSGMEMDKVTTYLEANFQNATQALTVDTWIHHDVLLMVDAGGSLTSRY